MKKGVATVVVVGIVVAWVVLGAGVFFLFYEDFIDFEVLQEGDILSEEGRAVYNESSDILFVFVRAGLNDSGVERLRFEIFVNDANYTYFRDYDSGDGEREYRFNLSLGVKPKGVIVSPVFFEENVGSGSGSGSGSASGLSSGLGGENGSSINVTPPTDPIEELPAPIYNPCNDNISYTHDLLSTDNETGEDICTNEIVLDIARTTEGSWLMEENTANFFSVSLKNKTTLDSISVYYRKVNSISWTKSIAEFTWRGIYSQKYVDYGWFPASLVNYSRYEGMGNDNLSAGYYEFKYVVKDIYGNYIEHTSSNITRFLRTPNDDDCIGVIQGHNNLNEDRINVVFLTGGSNATTEPYSGEEVKEKARFVINNPVSDYGRGGGFLHVEPFDSNADLFNFWYVNATDINVENACSFQNKIKVWIDNYDGISNAYHASTCSSGSLATVGREIRMRNAHPRFYASTFVHEIGHAVGGLRDEYFYKPFIPDICPVSNELNFSQIYPNIICVNNKFSETEQKAICEENAFWNNLGLECWRGCNLGRINCWRSTGNSLMGWAAVSESYFYDVNERWICHMLRDCYGFGDRVGGYCNKLCYEPIDENAKYGHIGCAGGKTCVEGSCV